MLDLEESLEIIMPMVLTFFLRMFYVLQKAVIPV